MSEFDIVREWLLISFDDYDSAKYLYDNKHPKPLEIICYHCQQSVEKSLKAFICANGVEITKTHELGLLCNKCSVIDNSFANFIEDCEDLEVYATHTRYPIRIDIDDIHAKTALEKAKTIYDFISDKINQLFE